MANVLSIRLFLKKHCIPLSRALIPGPRRSRWAGRTSSASTCAPSSRRPAVPARKPRLGRQLPLSPHPRPLPPTPTRRSPGGSTSGSLTPRPLGTPLRGQPWSWGRRQSARTSSGPRGRPRCQHAVPQGDGDRPRRSRRRWTLTWASERRTGTASGNSKLSQLLQLLMPVATAGWPWMS